VTLRMRFTSPTCFEMVKSEYSVGSSEFDSRSDESVVEGSRLGRAGLFFGEVDDRSAGEGAWLGDC
jgi:hypothetical protein